MDTGFTSSGFEDKTRCCFICKMMRTARVVLVYV